MPSRMVTLALRDRSRRNTAVSIDDIPPRFQTVFAEGPGQPKHRHDQWPVVVPYSVDGYRNGWSDFAEARLSFGERLISVLVEVQTSPQLQKEITMSNEGILARLGRVIAGVVNNAVDAAESSSPIAVAQQALRRSTKIAPTRRAPCWASASGHRLKAKAEDLDAEIRDLDEKIKTGLAVGLARVATGVQIDLEAQRNAIDKAIAENALRLRRPRPVIVGLAVFHVQFFVSAYRLQ